MISKNYLENGTVTATYINETDMGVTKIYHNGVAVDSSTTSLELNQNNKVQLEVKIKDFEDFCRVNNVKINIMPMSLAYTKPIMLEILSPNTVNTIEAFAVSDEAYRYEVDITKFVHGNSGRSMYFELTTEGNYNLSISSFDAPYVQVNYLDAATSMQKAQDVSGKVGKYVSYCADIKNGAFKLEKALYSLSGALMPINLNLEHSSYNSSKIIQKGFPLGWKFNYYQKLVQDTSTFKYYDINGIVHDFKPTTQSNKFIDRAGTGLILEVLSNGKYQISDTALNQLIFNTNKDIECVRNKYGDTFVETTFGYDTTGRLVSITDPMNNTVSITYTSSSIYLSCTNHKSIILSIENNFLTSINEQPGRITTFTYDIYGETDYKELLLAVETDNGEKATFDYDYANRVIQIVDLVVKNNTENVLEDRTIEYLGEISKVRNYHDVCMCYMFNESGQTISVYEDNNPKASISVKENGMETEVNADSTEEYVKFNGCNITITTSEYNADRNISKNAVLTRDQEEGTMVFAGDTEYSVSLAYVLDGSRTTALSGRESYMEVLSVSSSGVETLLHKEKLKLNALTETLASFTFKTLNLFDHLKFNVVHAKNTGTLLLSDVYVYKHRTNKRRVCFNADITEEVITCGTDTWYPCIEPFKKVSYTDLEGNTKIQNVKLYEEDFKINLRNYYLSNGEPFNLYYNKCKDIIFDVKNVFVYPDDVAGYPLQAFIMCILSETEEEQVFEYDDYSVVSDTVLRREYQKIVFEGTVYTNYKDIGKNFKVLEEKTFEGIVKKYSYDIYGNLLSEEVSSTASNTPKIIKNYTYLNNRYIQSISTLNGNLTTSTETYEYNNKGVVSKAIMPNGLEVLYTYDPNTLEVTKLTYTDGSQVIENNVTYDKDLVTKLAHKNNIGYDLTYDKFNKVKLVNSNYNGSINTVIDHEQNKTTLFDEFSIKYPTSYEQKVTIDKYGNNVKKTHSNGSSHLSMKEYYYSDDETVGGNDPLSETLNKTASSKLRKTVDKIINNQELFEYDSKSLLTKVTNTADSKPSVLEYDYDDHKRLTSKVLQSHDGYKIDNSFIYKSSGTRPTNEIEKTIVSVSKNNVAKGNYQVQLTKDTMKRKTQEVLTVGSKTINKSYTYSKTSDNKTTVLPSKIMYTHTSSSLSKAIGNLPTITTLLNTSYTYDNMNNITSVSDPKTNSNIAYSYDLFGRLIRENNQKLNTTTKFTYDDRGNITKKEVGVYTTASTFTPTSTINYSYSTTHTDRLTTYNGQALTYDLNGNITSIGSDTFNWSNGKQLTTSTVNSNTYTYSYNADGIRVRKATSTGLTHDYVLEGNRIIAEKITGPISSQSHEIVYIYSNDELIGMICDNTNYLFIKNLQNDIIGIVNSYGNIVARYEYDAWGNHKVYNSSGTENTSDTFIGNINPFRYRGYYYDKESELYYCQSRYYSPKLCRWLSLDSVKYLDPQIINGLNLYCYCGNEPVNRVDDKGDFWKTIWNNIINCYDTIYNSVTKNMPNNYKGTPIIVFNIPKLCSFSFGFIFLSQKNIGDSDTIKHEWGHTQQLWLLGIGDYLTMIAFPSIITNLIDRTIPVNYYNMPWEITADMFGGVIRPEHTNLAKQIGEAYLVAAELASNTIVKPALLPVYTTAGALIDGLVPGLGTTLLSLIYSS